MRYMISLDFEIETDAEPVYSKPGVFSHFSTNDDKIKPVVGFHVNGAPCTIDAPVQDYGVKLLTEVEVVACGIPTREEMDAWQKEQDRLIHEEREARQKEYDERKKKR